MASSSPNPNFEDFDTQVLNIRQEIIFRFRELVWIVQTRETELLRELETIAGPFREERKKQEEKLKELRGIYHLNEQNFRLNELKDVQRNILQGLSDEIAKLKTDFIQLPFHFSYDNDIVKVLGQQGEIKLSDKNEDSPAISFQNPKSSPFQPRKFCSIIYSDMTQPICGFCKKGNGMDELDRPWGITVDPRTENIFIADQCNNRVQVFNNDGEFVVSYRVSSGRGQMKWPICLAIHNDKLFISQHGNDCVTVFSLGGLFISQFGKTGRKNGEFISPRGIIINGKSSNILVCDYGNNRVQVFSGDYKFISKLGDLFHPQCIQLSTECIIILDEGNPCLHLFNFNNTLKRSFITHGIEGQIQATRTFCLDSLGNILMTDHNANSICIFSSDGVLIHEIKEGVIAPVGITLGTRGRIITLSDRDDNCLQFF